MNGQTIVKRSAGTAFQIVAGEAILIRLETGTYFSLNQVGTDFWDALDGKGSLADHARHIAQIYDQRAGDLVADLQALIRKAGDEIDVKEIVDRYAIERDRLAACLDQLSADETGLRAAELRDEFGVDQEIVLADLIQLATDLANEGLIEEVLTPA